MYIYIIHKYDIYLVDCALYIARIFIVNIFLQTVDFYFIDIRENFNARPRKMYFRGIVGNDCFLSFFRVRNSWNIKFIFICGRVSLSDFL